MDTLAIVYISLEAVIAALSIAGNVMVLAAVYFNRRLRSIVTNRFIASLAAADVMVGAVAIPCAIASYLGHPFGDFNGCIIMNTIIIVFTQISIFNLLAIAVERYAAIKHPYAYQRRFTMRNSNIVITITWLLAILLSLVPTMGWHLKPPIKPEDCAFTRVIDFNYMVFFNFFGCVLFPLAIVAVIYGYIFSVVFRQTRVIASLRVGEDEENGKRKRYQFLRDLKAAKSLSLIVFFFALCWIPLHTLNTISHLSPSTYYPFPLLVAAILLSHANSVVNPIIYAFTSNQYRRAFEKMFSGKIPDFSTETSAHSQNRPQLPTVSDAVDGMRLSRRGTEQPVFKV